MGDEEERCGRCALTAACDGSGFIHAIGCCHAEEAAAEATGFRREVGSERVDEVAVLADVRIVVDGCRGEEGGLHGLPAARGEVRRPFEGVDPAAQACEFHGDGGWIRGSEEPVRREAEAAAVVERMHAQKGFAGIGDAFAIRVCIWKQTIRGEAQQGRGGG